jgi:hypothetical protein
LPVASYTLPLYLLNAFQVFIVIITLLITYKMLQITEPALHTFLRNMKEAYPKHVQQLKVAEEGRVQMKGGEVESIAMLMGVLAAAVLQKNEPSLSKTQQDKPQEFPMKKSSDDSRGLSCSLTKPDVYDVHCGSTDTNVSIRSSRKSSGSVSETTPLTSYITIQ